MKNCILLILSVWVAAMPIAKAQTASADFAKNRQLARSLDWQTDWKGALRIEPFLGATATLSRGTLIDYQKSFHDVAEDGTTFKGAIQPLIWGTAGFQMRYAPFTEGGVLDKLSLSLGVQYLQKGFINQFKMTHEAPENFTDVTDYREAYRHDYWSIPFQARWGKKWFATIGVAFNQHWKSTKVQKLSREQSGANAVNGGFSTRLNDRKGILETNVNKSPTDFTLGGGVQLNDRTALAVQANLGGDILANVSRNYRTLFCQLSFFKSFQIVKQ
jgi:hypothetical protein